MHVTLGLRQCVVALFLDLPPVQMFEHVTEVAHVQHLAADRAADGVVALALRRKALRPALPEYHAAPCTGSASCTSKRLVAFPLMKPCRAAETSRLYRPRAGPGPRRSQVASRDQPHGLALALDAQAITVVLDFVDLVGADRHGFRCRGQAGLERSMANRLGAAMLFESPAHGMYLLSGARA